MTGIRFQSVTKILDGREVLRDVSLEVARGERLVIFGHSGCGKTTLLRLAAGLLAPDRGRIEIDDLPVAENGKNLVEPERRRVGMVFQDLALWPHLTVWGNLAFGLKAGGIPRSERHDHINEMLKRVHLQPYAKVKPARLSGGEQQRVALARALVLRPHVLLMDEPLSSLDRELNLALRHEILALHRELNFSLLYVTHSHEEAQQIGQRILRMKQGMIQHETT